MFRLIEFDSRPMSIWTNINHWCLICSSPWTLTRIPKKRREQSIYQFISTSTVKSTVWKQFANCTSIHYFEVIEEPIGSKKRSNHKTCSGQNDEKHIEKTDQSCQNQYDMCLLKACQGWISISKIFLNRNVKYLNSSWRNCKNTLRYDIL